MGKRTEWCTRVYAREYGLCEVGKKPKVNYPSKEEAKRIGSRRFKQCYPYLCECGMWHLTRRKRDYCEHLKRKRGE